MEEGILLEKLMGFGLTRQEAAIYLCLYQNGDMTGYEASKMTGISRSNVYNSMSSLVEKGAAYKREEAASKYVAVDIEEFCRNKIRKMQEDKDDLTTYLRRPQTEEDGYLTITGPRHIRDKVMNMLAQTRYRVYLSAPYPFVESLKEQLLELTRQNKKVVIITEKNPQILGVICYEKECTEEQIRLIVDSSYVLTGDAGHLPSDTCLYTGQKYFVSVFKEALRNEIKLIEMMRSQG